MICGYTPFASDNSATMYNLIRLSDVKFRKKLNISIHLQNLISGVNYILYIIDISINIILKNKNKNK
jgi:hypothetical protein